MHLLECAYLITSYSLKVGQITTRCQWQSVAYLGYEKLMRTHCTYLSTTSKWESDYRTWVLAAHFYYRKKSSLNFKKCQPAGLSNA